MGDKRPNAKSEHEARDKARTDQEGDYQRVLWQSPSSEGVGETEVGLLARTRKE
jgi:hypothetical protein